MDDSNNQVQFLLGDFNTRLREIDERNKLVRERVLLLGKGLLSSKDTLEASLGELKRENLEIKRELEKVKKTTNLLLTEFNKFVKRDEMTLLERMLKDFQPLEFVRRKDVEELIESKFNLEKTKKEIKSSRSNE